MKCPNCNGEIGRFELAPNCKHCGVNIFYCQQESFLTEDAKKCELEFASFRILSAKLKNAFIGGKIQILRIVAMVLAIGSVFIPFASFSCELPLLSAKLSLSALGLYQAFSDGTLFAFADLRGYLPAVFAAGLALLIVFVLIFLSGFGVFGALVLSFINMKKSARASCVLSVIAFVLCLACGITSFLLPRITAQSFVQGHGGFGAFVCALVFVMIFVLNLLVIKKDIQPDIKKVDLDRVEIRRQIKAGTITYDSLPLPVFESEEERQKRLAKEAESESLADKARGGEAK